MIVTTNRGAASGAFVLTSLALVSIVASNAVAACQDYCYGTSNPCRQNYEVADCGSNGDCVPNYCCDSAEEAAAQGECNCGDTIHGAFTLTRDFACSSGNGFNLDENSGTLNLDGHVISCSSGSCNAGVYLGAENNTVRGSAGSGGRISGFKIGVDADNSETGTQVGPHLTIEDGGALMEFGVRYAQTVTTNVISGAAATYAGNAISVGQYCQSIDDNLLTDSIRGISVGISQGGTGCVIKHNRALGNDYGFTFSSSGSFDTGASINNIMLNNSYYDLWDTYGSQRLTNGSNICRTTFGTGAVCSMDGMSFIP